jgi:hypothetical protein
MEGRCLRTEALRTDVRCHRMVVPTPAQQRLLMVVPTRVQQRRLTVVDSGAGHLLMAAVDRMVDSEGAMHLLTAAVDRLPDLGAATFQAVAEDIAGEADTAAVAPTAAIAKSQFGAATAAPSVMDGASGCTVLTHSSASCGNLTQAAMPN